MNGARSILMRKGYWLTALAAIVLLAASPGTAQAQLTATEKFGEGGVKVEVPKTVTEGNSATITISASADVAAGTEADARTVTVTVMRLASGEGVTNEAQDAQFNPGGEQTKVTLVFAANPQNDTVDAEAKTSVVSRTISLQTTQDPDAEDENVVLNVTVGGNLSADVANKSIKIEDDETQTYVFKVTTEDPEEGMPINVTLRADPQHVNDDLALTLHSSDPKYTVATGETVTNTVTIGNMTPQAGAAITVTPPGDDGNRVEDSFTLTAYSGSTGNSTEQASITIDVADGDELPAVAAMVVDKDGKALDPQPTSVAEGTSIMVMVMSVDDKGKATPAEERLTVALTPTGTADAADYTLVGAFTIENEAMASNRVELEVRADEDVGMESLMFDAVVSGDSKTGTETSTSTAVLSLYIDDETAKKIEPKATEADYDALKAAIAAAGGEDGLNPGDTVTLMTSDLFDVMDGYTASYGVSVAGDSASASASGESVTINALLAGEAKITVTGTARMASSSLMPSQTVSNVAELTFPVMVVDTELVVTLSAEPMEIAAGGTTMITATANRAVTVGDGAVEIALAVVGDGMLDPDSITIAMGDMSGSATLTANESVTVVATGSGVSGLMQVAVTVTDGPAPEPVPALPLIAQWLLGLGLMGGGARQLFRRRRQGS